MLGVESHGILAFLNASCKYLGTLQDLCIGLREPKFRVSVLGVESYGIVAFRNASFKWSMPQSSTIFFSDDRPGPSPEYLTQEARAELTRAVCDDQNHCSWGVLEVKKLLRPASLGGLWLRSSDYAKLDWWVLVGTWSQAISSFQTTVPVHLPNT